MTIRGVGIDVADVGRFTKLIAERGDAFTRKWFAASEIERCGHVADPGRAFAEHFAVKEAVWKSLGPGVWSRPLPWRSIVYMPDRGTVALFGAAEALAGSAAIQVAVAHKAGAAIATAVAQDRGAH